MTKAIYAATSDYVDELKSLHEKRRFSVSGILKRLGVSRSGYLAWKKHIPSDTQLQREKIKAKIQNIYDASHQNYGAPKITAELQKSGEHIAQKTAGNYMHQWGSEPSG